MKGAGWDWPVRGAVAGQLGGEPPRGGICWRSGSLLPSFPVCTSELGSLRVSQDPSRPREETQPWQQKLLDTVRFRMWLSGWGGEALRPPPRGGPLCLSAPASRWCTCTHMLTRHLLLSHTDTDGLLVPWPPSEARPCGGPSVNSVSLCFPEHKAWPVPAPSQACGHPCSAQQRRPPSAPQVAPVSRQRQRDRKGAGCGG